MNYQKLFKPVPISTIPKTLASSEPSESEPAESNLYVRCGLRAPEEDGACDETRAHMLVLPEDSCEAEFRWRAHDGAAKTLWLEGRRAILVPKNTPYKILWKKPAAFMRMALNDAFVAHDAAIQKLLASVQIRHEWQLASVDFLLHLLFAQLGKQCHHLKFPCTNRYIDSTSYLFAVHALKIFAAKETGATSGLSIPCLKRVLAHVDQNLSERIYVEDMAREAGLGTHYFTKLFKVSTGMTPHRYIFTKRVERAQELLWQKKMHVADVAAAVGFCDESYLWHSLKQFFSGDKHEAGISPERNRKPQFTTKKSGHTGATLQPGFPRTTRGKSGGAEKFKHENNHLSRAGSHAG